MCVFSSAVYRGPTEDIASEIEEVPIAPGQYELRFVLVISLLVFFSKKKRISSSGWGLFDAFL